MTRKIVVTSSIAVICFALCIITIESFFWCEYSHPIRIIIRELPGIIIGFYGIAFVFIIKYESKTLRKIIVSWFHRVLDKVLGQNRDGAYHCDAVNATNMSVEGKEYFEYYRKLWQAEKPRGWVGLRLKYCGF
uniref:Uncharacterized protein n=1 Tax=Panagrolaimus sp. JU765 TaxID=591449 RepID=A0AC34QLY0_9BILA